MGLIEGLKTLGKNVPDDISVVGFDDLNLLKFTSYDLTTVKQDFNKMGIEAFKNIAELLQGRSAQQQQLACKLIERGSVKQLN